MQFRSVDEFLALTGDDAPTTAEKALIEACRAGNACILSDTRPTAPSDANRVRAPLLRLLITGGTTECGLHVRGVWLEGAWIAERLDLDFCTAVGKTVLDSCNFDRMPLFSSAQLSLLSLQNSQMPGLYAQRLNVAGDLFLRGAVASNLVDLAGATVSGQIELDGATLRGADRLALRAASLRCNQGLLMRNVRASGAIDLGTSQIDGLIDCNGSLFDGAGREALNAQGLQCGQSVYLRDTKCAGAVVMTRAAIKGQLACNGAIFDGGGVMALNAQGVKTGDGVFLNRMSATGCIALNSATIAGPLVFESAKINGGHGVALNAVRMETLGGLFFRNLSSLRGRVELSSAHVGDLVDDVASWPKGADDLVLDGFTYDRLSGTAPVTLAARHNWLAIGSLVNGDFRPQPHTQFARTLRAMGHIPEARKVLFERDCLMFAEAEKADRLAYAEARNGDQTNGTDMGVIWCRLHLRRFWSWLSRTTIGHGHKPERSIGCVGYLIGIAALLSWLAWQTGSFAPNSDVILTTAQWTGMTAKGCVVAPTPDCLTNPAEEWSAKNAPGMDWDSFNAAAYAADLVVPLIDLGQTRAWAPSKDRGWMGWLMWWGRWVFIIAGWVVASLGLAAVTGFVQKNAPD